MKNKIAGKLFLYFSVALLLVGLIVGVLFALLFTNHTTKLFRQEMIVRAESIAETMSDAMDREWVGEEELRGQGRGGAPRGGGSGAGLGMSLRMVESAVGKDVWIVDAQSRYISTGRQGATDKPMPSEASALIDKALAGEEATGGEFSGLLGAKSLTVGVPIRGSDGNIQGAVLLHSPVAGTDQTISEGMKILGLSVAVSLVLGFIAASLLSLRFSRPLNAMRKTALRLAAGDYTAKTGLRQEDEIGQLSDAVDLLADRLAEAERESERLDELRKDFFTSVSHELRTPVAVMRSSLEALRDGVVTDSEKVHQYYRQLHTESLHLQKLVDDLLELSRLQNPDFRMERERVELVSLCEDVIRSMRLFARERRHTLTLSSEVKTAFFWGDYARLRQMVLIVIDNALKFGEEETEVSLTLKKQGTDLILAVENIGKDISPEMMKNLFEKFYRKQGGENKRGTGMGLAIASEIARRHGVELAATSRGGVTRFFLTFPQDAKEELSLGMPTTEA